jgi:hypothetical protein
MLSALAFSLVDELRGSGRPEGIFPVQLVYDRSTAEWCAGAALFERVSPEYYFPLRQSGIEQLVDIDVPGQGLIDPSSYTFSSDYAPAVSLIEALWSVPVQKTEPQSDVVLGHMLSRIAAANFTARGGARNVGHRVGIILSSDVPWAVVTDSTGSPIARRFGTDARVRERLSQALNAYRTFAAQNALSQIDLFYAVVTNSQSQGAVEDQRAALEELFEEARSDPLSGEPQNNFNVRLLVAGSAEEMRRGVATALVLSGRNVVLSK